MRVGAKFQHSSAAGTLSGVVGSSVSALLEKTPLRSAPSTLHVLVTESVLSEQEPPTSPPFRTEGIRPFAFQTNTIWRRRPTKIRCSVVGHGYLCCGVLFLICVGLLIWFWIRAHNEK